MLLFQATSLLFLNFLSVFKFLPCYPVIQLNHMDPTAPVIVTCRNKVFLAERVLIQRRECFDVPETWFYSIMKDWTAKVPLCCPGWGLWGLQHSRPHQPRHQVLRGVPHHAGHCQPKYGLLRQTKSGGFKNTSSLVFRYQYYLLLLQTNYCIWGLTSFFILCTTCTVRYNPYTVFPLGVLYPEHSQPAFLTLAVICLVQIHFCYTKKYTTVFIKSMYTAKASLIKL